MTVPGERGLDDDIARLYLERLALGDTVSVLPSANTRVSEVGHRGRTNGVREIEAALADLAKAGWRLRRRAPGPLAIDDVLRRYGSLPEEFTWFLAHVAELANPADNAWFLCEAAYNGTSASAWRWNEFELMSLEWCSGDRKLEGRAKAFWDAHCPFFLSVHSDYAYHAIDVTPEHYGKVVCGAAPEFEEPEVVAGSFAAVFKLITEANESIGWIL